MHPSRECAFPSPRLTRPLPPPPHPCVQVPLNDAERIYFIVVGILGTCFYSAVVGQMSVLVANMNTVGLRHK